MSIMRHDAAGVLCGADFKTKGSGEPLPFVYMVEDKMKKMKNCYLRVLIYPTDVSNEI